MPFHHLSKPGEALLVAGGDGSILVLPMGRDAFFRHFVHLFGADLHLYRSAVLGNYRGVQRLVKVWPRHGDEILDPRRDRPP